MMLSGDFISTAGNNKMDRVNEKKLMYNRNTEVLGFYKK